MPADDSPIATARPVGDFGFTEADWREITKWLEDHKDYKKGLITRNTTANIIAPPSDRPLTLLEFAGRFWTHWTKAYLSALRCAQTLSPRDYARLKASSVARGGAFDAQLLDTARKARTALLTTYAERILTKKLAPRILAELSSGAWVFRGIFEGAPAPLVPSLAQDANVNLLANSIGDELATFRGVTVDRHRASQDLGYTLEALADLITTPHPAGDLISTRTAAAPTALTRLPTKEDRVFAALTELYPGGVQRHLMPAKLRPQVLEKLGWAEEDLSRGVFNRALAKARVG